jgi:hypothetical protein
LLFFWVTQILLSKHIRNSLCSIFDEERVRFSPEKDKSNDLSSEDEAFSLSLKRRSNRSATEGGTLSMNCSSITGKLKKLKIKKKIK